MSDLSPLLDELIRRWKAAGARTRKGNSLSRIRGFEKMNGVMLPANASQFFLTVDGMEEGYSDEHWIHFWPLDEVLPAIFELPDQDPALLEGLHVFADYSLWAHAYALDLGPGSSRGVARIGGDEPVFLTPTFTAFLDEYLKNPDAL